MPLSGAKITNFNIENVVLVAPTEFPAEIAESFRLPLVLPNVFHKYGLFSKALYLQSALIGYVLAQYEAESGDVRVLSLKLLPAFENYGFEEEALELLRQDIAFLKEVKWEENQTVSNYVNGRHFSSTQIAQLQDREALGGLRLGKLLTSS